MKQINEHKKMGPLQGLLLIIGLIAALLVLNAASSLFLAPLIGHNPAALVFWCIGAAIAFQVLRVYIASIVYELNNDMLSVCRFYGKKSRAIENIYLRQLLFVGAREEAEKRYPKRMKVRALHPSCKLPVTAVVYKTSDSSRMALLQLNDEMKAALMERLKAK